MIFYLFGVSRWGHMKILISFSTGSFLLADVSAAETRQVSTVATGRCPVSILYICLVSRAEICPVSAADICPVSTADICPFSAADIYPVSTEDIWMLWRHLEGTKQILTPFLHLKYAKWNTPAEKPEKPEPRKWGHGPLLAASVHPQNHLRGCTQADFCFGSSWKCFGSTGK